MSTEPLTIGSIKHYPDLEQGSDEWRAIRCGLLTASEMKLILTPSKLQYADNDKVRSHVYELAAQRITGHVEPSYVNDDMLRGIEHEDDACDYYHDNYAPVERVGFITNDSFGFTLGYSPDRTVGDDGLIEVKCPRQKAHMQTIIDANIPSEHILQVQTGLLVSGRKWCDFISYHGGLPMFTVRVYPDAKIQTAIIQAAKKFEDQVAMTIESYQKRLLTDGLRLVETERKVIQEII